jgi:septal ring factor EnvC (AmiA/AmiB activator)
MDIINAIELKTQDPASQGFYLKKALKCYIWILQEKTIELSQNRDNLSSLENHMSALASEKLASEMKSKDSEIEKSKSYAEKLASEMKSKDSEIEKSKEHLLKLSSEIENYKNENENLKKKLQLLAIVENNQRKYYDSRL